MLAMSFGRRCAAGRVTQNCLLCIPVMLCSGFGRLKGEADGKHSGEPRFFPDLRSFLVALMPCKATISTAPVSGLWLTKSRACDLQMQALKCSRPRDCWKRIVASLSLAPPAGMTSAAHAGVTCAPRGRLKVSGFEKIFRVLRKASQSGNGKIAANSPRLLSLRSCLVLGFNRA